LAGSPTAVAVRLWLSFWPEASEVPIGQHPHDTSFD